MVVNPLIRPLRFGARFESAFIFEGLLPQQALSGYPAEYCSGLLPSLKEAVRQPTLWFV